MYPPKYPPRINTTRYATASYRVAHSEAHSTVTCLLNPQLLTAIGQLETFNDKVVGHDSALLAIKTFAWTGESLRLTHIRNVACTKGKWGNWQLASHISMTVRKIMSIRSSILVNLMTSFYKALYLIWAANKRCDWMTWWYPLRPDLVQNPLETILKYLVGKNWPA